MHTLIVCGGTPPKKNLLEMEIEIADLVLGADSGGHALIGYGFTPDLVIGDLDSFHYTNHKGIHTLKDENQEINDLEKCLDYALAQGTQTVIVLGANGKRIDHTFKNLSVLQKYHPRFESLVYRDEYGDTFMVDSPASLQVEVGTVVSLLPINGKVSGIKTYGLEYALDDESLEVGQRDGSSNKAFDTKVEISYSEGHLAVFIGTGAKLNV